MGLDPGIKKDFVRQVTFERGLGEKISIMSSNGVWERGT